MSGPMGIGSRVKGATGGSRDAGCSLPIRGRIGGPLAMSTTTGAGGSTVGTGIVETGITTGAMRTGMMTTRDMDMVVAMPMDMGSTAIAIRGVEGGGVGIFPWCRLRGFKVAFVR